MLKRFLISLLIVVAGIISADAAPTWISLLYASDVESPGHIDMNLERYGLYQNGKEMNSFVPSQKNNNYGEWIEVFLFEGNECIIAWNDTADGDAIDECTFSGSRITYKTREKDDKTYNISGYMDLLSFDKLGNNKFRVKTVDSHGTYRYYIATIAESSESSDDDTDWGDIWNFILGL